MSSEDHKKQAGRRPVACAVITCSDTRTEKDDVSGKKIQKMLRDAGHTVTHYEISKDEPAAIRRLTKTLAGRRDIQAVLFNGGTGISRRDNTYTAVAGQLHKFLPGFGELFRMLSYESIGSAAMLSRAIAGVIVSHRTSGDPHHTVVFVMPGAPNAVELAMTKLILPELSHLVWETLR